MRKGRRPEVKTKGTTVQCSSSEEEGDRKKANAVRWTLLENLEKCLCVCVCEFKFLTLSNKNEKKFVSFVIHIFQEGVGGV